MIAKILAVSLVTAIAAAGQSFAQQFWFDDGAGVELRTETDGSPAQTKVFGGGTVSWDQATRNDIVSRVVVDSQNKTLFAYELQANRGPMPDEVTIRLKPETGSASVSALREFKGVKYGQEVKIEILSNPSTGEKVYDVLRPVEGPNPSPGHRNIQGVSIPKVSVNGQSVSVKSSWSGGPARLSIPGDGAYFLAWESRPKYRVAGYVDKNRLIFFIDAKYVEMTFPANLLDNGKGGPVWVYHDPNFVPENRGGAVCSLDSY